MDPSTNFGGNPVIRVESGLVLGMRLRNERAWLRKERELSAPCKNDKEGHQFFAFYRSSTAFVSDILPS